VAEDNVSVQTIQAGESGRIPAAAAEEERPGWRLREAIDREYRIF
jgi:hypothetical protein